MAIKSIYTLLLRAFLLRGKARVFPAIPSEQLQAGLYTQEFTDRTGAISVPHYWARWLHDGRGPAPGAAGSGSLLVWFRDPKDDPRYPGGKYPVKLSQKRRLTKGQFRKWARINQGIINNYRRTTGRKNLTASDYRAMRLPMIVAKNSPGDRGQVMGTPFFSNAPGGGMSGFRAEANQVGSQIFSKYVTERLEKRGLLNKKVSVVIRI